MASIESRAPFPPDVVGILYPLALVDSRINWVDGDGNIDRRLGGGWVDFVGGAEVICMMTIMVAINYVDACCGSHGRP